MSQAALKALDGRDPVYVTPVSEQCADTTPVSALAAGTWPNYTEEIIFFRPCLKKVCRGNASLGCVHIIVWTYPQCANE